MCMNVCYVPVASEVTLVKTLVVLCLHVSVVVKLSYAALHASTFSKSVVVRCLLGHTEVHNKVRGQHF